MPAELLPLPSPHDQTLQPIKLTDKEQFALNYFYQSPQPEIAPSTAARMFQLFLNGSTTEYIHSLNRGFSLAQIVHARIKGQWDQQRDAYLKDLLELTRIREMQTTLESIHFVADMLSVANHDFGERFKRFLLTRDTAELGEMRIDSIKDYKDAVALFQALTGQDKQTKVGGELLVTHRAAVNEPPSSVEAASVLKALAGK